MTHDEAAKMIAGLDRTAKLALLEVIKAFSAGKDTATAYARGNTVLTAAGRQPVSPSEKGHDE